MQQMAEGMKNNVLMVQQLEFDKHQLVNDNTLLRSRLEKSEKIISTLQNALSSTDTTVRDLQTALLAFKDRSNENEKEMQLHKQIAYDSSQKVEQMKIQLEKMNHEVQQIDARNQELEQQKTKALKFAEDFSKERNLYISEIEQLRNEVIQKGKALEKLQNDHTNVQHLQNKIQLEIEQLNSKIQKLSNDKVEMAQMFEGFITQAQQKEYLLMQENDKLKKENEEKQQQIHGLRNCGKDVVNDLEQLKSELE